MAGCPPRSRGGRAAGVADVRGVARALLDPVVRKRRYQKTRREQSRADPAPVIPLEDDSFRPASGAVLVIGLATSQCGDRL